MAKTNFTKVEGALDEGLRQMTVQHLHALADSIKGLRVENIEKSDIASQKKIIAILKFELTWMESNNISLPKDLGVTKSEIKKIIEKAPPLESQDFEKIKTIKNYLETLKKELEKALPQSNDEIVEKERVKHINKRFNTNDKWLPLH